VGCVHRFMSIDEAQGEGVRLFFLESNEPSRFNTRSMLPKTVRFRQALDWTAAVWAGLISGVVFLIVAMILTSVYLGSPWVIPRLTASVLLGPGVLPPPATFQAGIVGVGVLVHLCLSVLFAYVIAFTLHRWGILVGIIGGALFGLAFFYINFFSVSYFFPWFFPVRSWLLAVAHVAYGAMAGGTYEALEVEKFVPIKD
jgi:hypothetical protein